MKISAGNLLPLNTFGLPNATGGPADPTQFYVAGDVRANEQVGLTAIHTLMLREHNRLADQIAAENPGWTDEQIYQRARKLVGGEVQVITYNEFLPALLGSYAPSINSVYDPGLDASVLTEFSTALYRVGHTMLSPNLMRMENDGSEAPGGPMPLRHAFFVPQNLASGGELEHFLKGLASDQQQEVDMHMVDDVRNFLFGEPIPGGFDLASLNIQRGRDHGLPDYNSIRVAFGLPAAASFADITSDPAGPSRAASAVWHGGPHRRLGRCALGGPSGWLRGRSIDHGWSGRTIPADPRRRPLLVHARFGSFARRRRLVDVDAALRRHSPQHVNHEPPGKRVLYGARAGCHCTWHICRIWRMPLRPAPPRVIDEAADRFVGLNR